VGRFALVLLLLAPAAAAAAPFSLELGFGTGIGWARRSGMYRDDDVLTLRIGEALGRRASIDFGISEDTERIEPAFRLGGRWRPFWTAHWSAYLRGELAFVGGSHFGSNYDLLVGVGHFWRLSRWLAAFVETDVVSRTGEVGTLSNRFEAGLSLTAPTFWH
jgi:hypothetical protein